MDDGRLRLNSYRLAFALERRIHRIDTFRIPLPYGLPLASLGWGVVAIIAMLAFSAVPGVGPVLGALPFPVRLVFLPGLFAHLVSRTTGDGRPFHEALIARVRRCVPASDRPSGGRSGQCALRSSPDLVKLARTLLSANAPLRYRRSPLELRPTASALVAAHAQATLPPHRQAQ